MRASVYNLLIHNVDGMDVYGVYFEPLSYQDYIDILSQFWDKDKCVELANDLLTTGEAYVGDPSNTWYEFEKV